MKKIIVCTLDNCRFYPKIWIETYSCYTRIAYCSEYDSAQLAMQAGLNFIEG